MKKKRSGTAAGRKSVASLMEQGTGPGAQASPQSVEELMRQGKPHKTSGTGTQSVKSLMRQ